MNNPEPQTPTPVWKTIMWPAAALGVVQAAFLLVMNSDLVWFVFWLFPAGIFFVPLIALAVSARFVSPPQLSALLVLPVVLYATGVLSCFFVWWVDGAPPPWHPFASMAKETFGVYGPYGVTAGIVWVGCLLRTLKYTLTAHRTKTRIED